MPAHQTQSSLFNTLAVAATGLVTAAALVAVPLVSHASPASTATATNYYYPGTVVVPAGYTRCPIAIIDDLDSCIASATAGDTISIAAGTYTESSTLNKAVNLVGLGAGAIFVAESGARVLTVTGAIDSSTVISNLTLTGGSVPAGAGGGIYLDPGATPLLQSLVIHGNSANDGGGLYAYHAITANNLLVYGNTAATKGGGVFVQDAITLNGGQVMSNSAGTDGGGLYAGGLFDNASALNGVVVQNNQSAGGNGGGVYLGGAAHATNTISAGAIVGNSAPGGIGGGVFTPVTLTVNSSRFESNLAGGAGGMHVESTVYVSATDFLSNTAETGGGLSAITAHLSGGTVAFNRATSGSGGGIALASGSITSTAVYSNAATLWGGGVYIPAGPAAETNRIINATVLSNTADAGGGLFLGGAFELLRSRVAYNIAATEGGGVQIVSANSARVAGNRIFDNRGLGEGGGGMYIAASNVLLDNNFIAANVGVTTTHAAEIGIGGVTPSRVLGSQNTFVARFAGTGLGIEVGKDAADTVLLTNTIFARYTIGMKTDLFASNVQLNTVLWDNVLTRTTGSTFVLSNSLSGSALFVNPAARNYHLQNGSAAIDTGVDSGVAVDIDGQARPFNGLYDIGADEKLVNGQPVANAGPDQSVVVGRLVTLDGAASADPEGDTLTHGWSQLAGPAVSLSSATAVAPTFVAPGAPTPYSLRFRLVVTDELGLASVGDIITVTVINNAPVANAGLDASASGATLVTLNGGASADPDGHGLIYAWRQTGGPGVVLAGSNTLSASFTAPNLTTVLTFGLRVTDTYGLGSAEDPLVISITVNNAFPTATPLPSPTPTQTPQRTLYLPLTRRS